MFLGRHALHPPCGIAVFIPGLGRHHSWGTSARGGFARDSSLDALVFGLLRLLLSLGTEGTVLLNVSKRWYGQEFKKYGLPTMKY